MIRTRLTLEEEVRIIIATFNNCSVSFNEWEYVFYSYYIDINKEEHRNLNEQIGLVLLNADVNCCLARQKEKLDILKNVINNNLGVCRKRVM